MGAKIDLIGKTFGRLLVIKEIGHDKRKNILWECRCTCGNITIARGDDLKAGKKQSCGCLQIESRIKHGNSYTVEHQTWCSMIHRCTQKKSTHYHSYGGRGIRVCNRWKDFNNFLSDMGRRPTNKKFTIERLNNDGNYEPSNCIWATRTTQARNKRISKTNTTGVNGVTWSKQRKKYKVRIKVKGKETHLGYFDLMSDAIEARRKGEIKYWEKADLLEAEDPDKIIQGVAN